jgi:hypothetical protein
MSVDIRIRFDDRFDDLVDELRDLPFFGDNGSVALFCAALGFDKKTTHIRKRGNRDVRLNVLIGIPGALELTYLVGIISSKEAVFDPLSDAEIEQRVKVFEGYVNGGLSILKESKRDGRNLQVIVTELVTHKVQQIKKGN